MPTTPIILSIAGSDSGGGAGIQADIKAISATGGFACTVITATTAQNTLGVTDVHPIPITNIEAQLDAVFSDLDIQAVKIGMLADSAIIQTVAEKLRQYAPRYIILDPVMVATSGDLLLQQEAIVTLKEALLPLATVITPNLPEAATLLGCRTPHSYQEIEALIPELQQLATPAVLLKGGHLQDQADSTDWLVRASGVQTFLAPRINTHNTHGTGCTLSAAIASYLGQGNDLETAITLAKQYLTGALAAADQLKIGQGHGPVHHFYQLRG